MAPYRQCRVFASIAGLLLALGGCAEFPATGGITGNVPGRGPILPDTSLNLTPGLQIPLEKIVFWGAYGAAAYLILDPLNPNWELEQASFPDQHYHFSLRMKRFYAGGAGEARMVFHQRAKELMRRGGYTGYTVVEYSEGLDSSVLGSYRVAQGVVRLTGPETVAPEKTAAAAAVVAIPSTTTSPGASVSATGAAETVVKRSRSSSSTVKKAVSAAPATPR